MIENLGSLLQQTEKFSESWIWTLSEWCIWTVSESRIWTQFWSQNPSPYPKQSGRIFSEYPVKNIWILNRENLGSLLQQTGRFSESWIWTYFEPKIRAPLPKEVGGLFEYPEQDIIWILNKENLESLLQQIGRFSGTKFEPKIFKF